MVIEMAIDRRALLIGLAAFASAPNAVIANGMPEPAYVTCCRLPDGGYAASVLNEAGDILFSERLDGRGHDAALSADGSTAIVFARRPGRFAVRLDLTGRLPPLTFSAPGDRHFYGHGFFSPDGAILFSTENDFEADRGIIGLYDVAGGFERIGEFESGGIGPHEAILMADGRTICVANGGIATHPDYPRQKLNLATMAPCLSYLDIATGELIDRAHLATDHQRLSVRHMTEVGGQIWFGGQYEGSETDDIALVGTHRPGRDMTLNAADPVLYRGMNHYIGSVVSSRDGTRVATASPRGGQVLIWDATTRAVLEVRTMPDVCGIANRGTEFLTSGREELRTGTTKLARHPGYLWDNHIAGISRHKGEDLRPGRSG